MIAYLSFCSISYLTFRKKARCIQGFYDVSCIQRQNGLVYVHMKPCDNGLLIICAHYVSECTLHLRILECTLPYSYFLSYLVSDQDFVFIIWSHFADIGELNLPNTTVISFPNGKDDLMNFEITTMPDEGYYK